MKSLSGQVSEENPGQCLQGRVNIRSPFPHHFHGQWVNHSVSIFVWQSQETLYRKLDVERTLAHFLPVDTQKTKLNRNDASSLDSWLSWTFCPEFLSPDTTHSNMSSFVAFHKQPPVGCNQQNPDCGKLCRTHDQISSISKLHEERKRKRRNIVQISNPISVLPFLGVSKFGASPVGL